jgi:hypothetical protein
MTMSETPTLELQIGVRVVADVHVGGGYDEDSIHSGGRWCRGVGGTVVVVLEGGAGVVVQFDAPVASRYITSVKASTPRPDLNWAPFPVQHLRLATPPRQEAADSGAQL